MPLRGVMIALPISVGFWLLVGSAWGGGEPRLALAAVILIGLGLLLARRGMQDER